MLRLGGRPTKYRGHKASCQQHSCHDPGALNRLGIKPQGHLTRVMGHIIQSSSLCDDPASVRCWLRLSRCRSCKPPAVAAAAAASSAAAGGTKHCACAPPAAPLACALSAAGTEAPSACSSDAGAAGGADTAFGAAADSGTAADPTGSVLAAAPAADFLAARLRAALDFVAAAVAAPWLPAAAAPSASCRRT